MANFCVYCGKPLQEGEVCTCRTGAPQQPEQQPAYQQTSNYQQIPNYQQAAYQQPAQPNPQVQQIKRSSGAYSGFVKSYLRNPMQATSNVLNNKDMMTPIITLVIYAIVSALYAFLGVRCIADQVANTVEDVQSYLRVNVEVPFFSLFCIGVVMAAVTVVLRVVVLFLVAKIDKKPVPIKDVFLAVCVNLLLPAAVMVLMIIAMYINGIVMMAVSMIGLFLQFILMIGIFTQVFGGRFTALQAMLVTVFMVAAMLLGGWINGSLHLKGMEKVEITLKDSYWGEKETHEISEYLEELKDEMDDMDVDRSVKKAIRESISIGGNAFGNFFYYAW